MAKLTEQVQRQIEAYGMIQAEDMVVAGLSGGEDSVCLLAVLKSLSVDMRFSLAALHVHHGIRREEADEDALFCERLCAGWKIPFEVVYVDVPSLAAERKQSLEEAARQERYKQLEHYRIRLGAQRIAVAHHQEDNAETVLWNLLRGAGLRGLAGMEPVSGRVIRPFLETPKSAIHQYMKAQGISWREDSTNGEDHYTRNRIRHHVLRYAVEELNSQATKHICQTAEMAAEADAYLQAQAKKWLRENSRREGCGPARQKISLDAAALKREERVLRRYIVREAVCYCKGLKDTSLRQVDAVCSLLEEQPGKSASREVHLGDGCIASKSYGTLTVEWSGSEKPADTNAFALKEQTIEKSSLLQGSLRIQMGGQFVEVQVFPRNKSQKIPTNQYTKWLDYDRIKKSLVFRFRQPGDYFFLPDGKRKTVKAYMIDEKIPQKEREHILVAAEGSHVLWIVGRRLCESVKITEDTRQILQIIRYGGKEDGEDSRIDSGGRGRQENW